MISKELQNWEPVKPNIPKKWIAADFSDIFTVVSTNNLKIKEKEYLDEGLLPVIDQGARLIGGYTNLIEKKIELDCPLIVFGDHTRSFKYISFVFVPGADGIKVLVPHPLLDSKFLYYYCHILELPNRGYSRHFSFLKKSVFPLPSLAEQNRIVDKIEMLFSDLDKGNALLKQVQQQLAVYRQSFLKSAIMSSDSELIKLDELGDWFGGGTPSKREKSYWCNGEIPWVSPKDMKKRFISSSEDKITEDALMNSSAKLVTANSVLMVMRSGILIHSFPVAVNSVDVSINQDIKALTPYMQKVLPEYLMICIEALEKDILHKCSKNGTTVQSIEFERLKKYEVPVPKIQKQQWIIERINKLFSQIDALEKWCATELARSEMLRQSILKAAFSGVLVPQDPEDEPASELLARIQAERASAARDGNGRQAATKRGRKAIG